MHPYKNAESRQFWSRGVVSSTPETIQDVYRPKWPISGLGIATAGSCFAQEIAKALRARKYYVIDAEPAPGGTRGSIMERYGYGQYSARHGNIYTSRHLLQLTREALGQLELPAEVLVWEKDGRYYDSMRPSVEPDGLDSPEIVIAQRKDHLRRFRSVLKGCDLFVFTLGLTEAWRHKETGLFFQSAPGQVAGVFDPDVHEFHNMRYPEILEDMQEFMRLARTANPNIKFLLTVSPVPLTATYESQHALVATVRSKSVLRAVADELARGSEDVDYFPSYEILSTPFLGAHKYQDNLRGVRPDGVEAVMSVFFAAHEYTAAEPVAEPAADLGATDVSDVSAANTEALAVEQVSGSPAETTEPGAKTAEEVVCEDALLEGFAPR